MNIKKWLMGGISEQEKVDFIARLGAAPKAGAIDRGTAYTINKMQGALNQAHARLGLAEGLLLEIFKNMKPRDCVSDWYDRAKEYLEKYK